MSAADGTVLARRTGLRVAAAEMLANGLGAVDVFLLLSFVLPMPAHHANESTLLVVNAAVCGGYLLVSAVVGNVWGKRTFDGITAWLREGRPPTEAERAAILGQPVFCTRVCALGWGVAAVLFTLINLPASTHFALHIGTTIVMGGLTCCAVTYLLVERVLQPVTAEALVGWAGPASRPNGLGVIPRLVLAWVCATGVPLAGLIMLGAQALSAPDETSLDKVAGSVIALAVLGLAAGLLATWLVARSIADPLTGVRRALGRIEQGDLAARVTVTDGSEVGLLQSRFNAMAADLAERERLREVFGRHVGEDVARRALDGDGPRLGGEVRDVAVLFVDLIGSTSLAARRAPADVVRVLNDFFAVVVDVVGRHGGWVNKFEGDAALVVFGAPADHPDPAGAALTAARELRRRLHVVPQVDAGIGLSAGAVVAGNVGAERRFEYTVIGTPVNEAARLCELAKRRDERLLASVAVLDRARNGEAGRWERCDELVLRGRRVPTRIARPSDPVADLPAAAAV
ncbi:MAG TPA: adenylate/guanylate cyclase domain-containing protein [Solirubrobacteraceae bacterium]|jgi:adenylate cyclase|nr:adenylate/guanylate cyclase domain-containing protein [Solirubrobacteraceae bacterium]